MDAINDFLGKRYKIILFVIGLVLLVAAYAFFFVRVHEHGNAEWMIFALGLYALITIVISFFLLHERKASFEATFLFVFIMLGIVYMFLFGPMKAPDETSHYEAAYRYSNIIMGMDGNSQDIPMRNDDYEFVKFWSKDYTAPEDDYVDQLGQFSLMANDASYSVRPSFKQNTLSTRHFQQHIVAAIGITVGRLIGLSAIVTYYLGRLFAFAVFAALAFLVLKIVPIAKPAFAMVFLLPRTLELSASYSYDGPAIILALLLSACCLYSIFKKSDIPWTEMAWIVVLAVLLVPCKVVYAVIIVLVFFIPNTRFSKTWQAYLFKGFVVFAAAATFVVASLSAVVSMATVDTTVKDDYSLADMMKDPGHAIGKYAATLAELSKETRQLSGQIREIFGGRLANHGKLYGPWDVVMGIMLCFVLSCLMEKEIKRITPLMRSVCVLAFVLAVFAIYTSMLLSFSNPKLAWINGIQGRYFIPLMPLIIISFTGLRIHLVHMGKNFLLTGYLLISFYYSAWICTSFIIR